MILEWSDYRNDPSYTEAVYFRIKIFTAEGKKYGDIEIPYNKAVGLKHRSDLNSVQDVADIRARTIRPDGSIIPFTGQIFDHLIVKGKGFKYLDRKSVV